MLLTFFTRVQSRAGPAHEIAAITTPSYDLQQAVFWPRIPDFASRIGVRKAPRMRVACDWHQGVTVGRDNRFAAFFPEISNVVNEGQVDPSAGTCRVAVRGRALVVARETLSI